MGKWSLQGQREGTSAIGGASGRTAFSQSPVPPFSPSPPGTQVLIPPHHPLPPRPWHWAQESMPDVNKVPNWVQFTSSSHLVPDP